MTARARLKAATHAAHDRVDACFSGFDLAAPQGYRDFLAVHAAVVPGCEAALARTAILGDWHDRARTDALAADVASLGGAMPRSGASADLDIPAAWGMAYVLEGSRLGGAVLARRVLANPDPACRVATNYLRHGQGRGLWPSFVAAFDRSTTVANELDEVVAGALMGFELFLAAASSPVATMQR